MPEDNFTQVLEKYASCDVADALRKLGIIGYIPRLTSFSKGNEIKKIVGPIYPVKFVYVEEAPEIPTIQGHYMDHPPEGSVVLVMAPDDAENAVLGGLVAKQGKNLKVAGCVVLGLIRDIEEIHELGLPVFARGTSCLGAGGFVRCISRDTPMNVPVGFRSHTTHLTVQPGDILVADADGVVICPKTYVMQVAKECEAIISADLKVNAALDEEGLTLSEAFSKYR
ncbi:MAG: ribonuclease E inhibitor RraA/Dimethylmenaquinone methyltransferase [Piptocephalis tieghemiana]|nr:MAG: ribonuclease E inhibitor RraA/Dimethylmenaquinone methyltransferase [Piptocephalis tieghemiana]